MDSEIMASPVSSSCAAAAAPGGGGNESEGSPSEEKMASPPASSAVCSDADDAMVDDKMRLGSVASACSVCMMYVR